MPLVVLAVVADLTRPDAPVSGLLPTQNAVVAASFCTLAWLFGRYSPWPVAVAGWTVPRSASSGLRRPALPGLEHRERDRASVLLGVMWTVVFMVAWSTRDRAARAEPAAGPRADAPAPAA